MKQQKTVESRVLEILKECPMSRYDDMMKWVRLMNSLRNTAQEIVKAEVIFA